MGIMVTDAPVPSALDIALRSASLVSPVGSAVSGANRRTTVEFDFDRQPPADWIRLLREHYPITEAHSFPWLMWDPGDPWLPRERWIIMDTLHEKTVENWDQGFVFLDELYGPHPRSEGHMCWDGSWRHHSARWPKQFRCNCRRKLDAWKGGPAPSITILQWNLFRQTGYVGFPMWVIQGDKGGHLLHYPEEMQDLLKRLNLPHEPPGIAAQPYADFDMRTIRGLNRYNRLKQLNVNLSEFRRTMGSGYEAHKARLAKEARRQWIEAIGAQMEDGVNDLFIRAARRGELDNQRRTRVDYDRLDDAATETYIESGRVLHPTEADAVTP